MSSSVTGRNNAKTFLALRNIYFIFFVSEESQVVTDEKHLQPLRSSIRVQNKQKKDESNLANQNENLASMFESI